MRAIHRCGYHLLEEASLATQQLAVVGAEQLVAAAAAALEENGLETCGALTDACLGGWRGPQKPFHGE